MAPTSFSSRFAASSALNSTNVFDTENSIAYESVASTSGAATATGSKDETSALKPTDEFDKQAEIGIATGASLSNGSKSHGSHSNTSSASSSNGTSVGQTVNSSTNVIMATIKVEGQMQRLEVFQPPGEVMNQVDQLLDGQDDSEADENDSEDGEVMMFIDDGKPFPLPFNCTIDNLIKREKDVISGDLAFSEKKVSNFFISL